MLQIRALTHLVLLQLAPDHLLHLVVVDSGRNEYIRVASFIRLVIEEVSNSSLAAVHILKSLQVASVLVRSVGPFLSVIIRR